MQHNKKIYPDVQNHENKGDDFRLNEVSKCLTYLETELKKREQIFKKYKRTHSLLMKTNAISGTLSVLISGSAVGTSLTVVLIPVGVSLASIGGFFGFVSVLTGLIAKKISPKLNKHLQTVSVCNAKLNTIKDLISKALQDNDISPEEFRLIMSEVEKYKKLKNSFRVFKNQVNMKNLKRQVRSAIMKSLKVEET